MGLSDIRKGERNSVMKELEEAKKIIKKFMRFTPIIGQVAFYHEEWEETIKLAKNFIKKNETIEEKD